MFVRKMFIMFFGAALTLFGQFGQNRVQYKDFDWYFIQTEHFDIYFTQNGKNVAEFTAHAAEEAYESLSSKLNYQLNNRLSLVVYDSHNDFQETNITDGYLSQGIGGFTEPFKNRVVFPFEGSYEKFRHVIAHELVHGIMSDMLYGGSVQNILSKGITLQLPLWYQEGMAEYLSSGWETNSDMFIRDAIINEYLPDIPQLGGYFAYRGGQSVFRYIANKYGEEKVGEILNKTKGLGSLEAGLKASIGLDIEELNDRWKKELKKEYWPGIADREDPGDFAKRLTDNTKVGGFYNTSPAISPQGDKIVFISDRDIYLDIYIMNTLDGEIIDEIIETGTTNDFEELNILFPALTWAPDNKRIALSVKSGGMDAIVITDVESGDKEELPIRLDGIESVTWSPDGKMIAFNGSNSSQSDIYIYDLENQNLINLTNDIFSDAHPSWSPDNKKLFFSSDRGDFLYQRDAGENFAMYNHDFAHTDIYSIDLEERKIDRITNWIYSNEEYAVISPDSKEMLFVSDFNGISNIYKKKLVDEENPNLTALDLPAYPLTNSLNGISQLSISADGEKLVFTSLFNSGYNIFLMNNPFESEPVTDTLEYTSKVVRGENAVVSNKTNDLTVKKSREEINLSSADDIPDTTGNTRIYSGQYAQDNNISYDTSKTDYSNYVFGQTDENLIDSSKIAERNALFSEKLDENGDYLVNKYKISFSPDLIYANAGYSTLYGLLGTTVLSFSDMLGNHRLIGVTSLQIDLKNSDYGLAYYYLPQRINYGVEAFHTARFVYLSRGATSDLFRFRNFGGVLSASLPFNRFYRFSASLALLSVSAENLDNISEPTEHSTYLIPSLSFVHDNVLWGYTSPIEGTRYNFTIFGNPGISKSRQSFYSLTMDYRKYFRFWFDNSFVFRLSGGYSGGGTPQRFFIGGTDYWINREFATGDIPLENAADFAFLTPGLPLRGYNYAEQIGTKYALLNLELRMPLIRYLLTGPLPLFFQNILGVAYIDAGSAWNNTSNLKFIGRNNSGKVMTQDLLLGTGYGFRLYFIFLWRFDVAWSYDLRKFSAPKYYFSLGLDF